MSAAGSTDIDRAAERFRQLLDEQVPGLLTGLHLIGSAVDGDFRAGQSDLDFVAVLARPLTEGDSETLAAVHRLYGRNAALPLLDGIWLTAAELVAGPDAVPDGPTSRDGVFLAVAQGNRNPVTWIALRDQSRAVVGMLPPDLWYDPARLLSWTRQNVETYWVHWLADAKRPLTGHGRAMFGETMPMWGVLGIGRIHHTLATGGIASKSAAGQHALAAFEPRWHRIVGECLRIRHGAPGSLYRNPFSRRREALDFVAMVIETIRISARR